MEKTKIIKKWLDSGSINIFGRPFSGKDTQAKFLSRTFGAPIIGGGDIIRASQDKALKDHTGGGHLAPSQDYLDMVLPYFSQEQFDNRPLVLSIVGRWSGEEVRVVDALQKSGHELKAVIYLNLSEEEVLKRHAAAKTVGDRVDRADDTRHALEVRFEEFRNKTLPVLEYYREKGLLVEIEGNQPPAKVTQDILDGLLSHASASQ